MSRRPQRPRRSHRPGASGGSHGVSPGRLAAGRALLEAERGRHLDEALTDQGLKDPAELRHAWHIAFGVMRQRGELDVMIQGSAKRPMGRMDPPVRVALRVGLLERHFSRTASHAAVDQAVRLCKALGSPYASGFVNAVLRKAVPEAQPASVNHPTWLIKRWVQRYGEEAVEAWCARNDTPPPLSVACLGEVEPLVAAFEAAGLSPRPAVVNGAEVPGVFWLDAVSGAVTELPGFAEGQWFVMDAAAAAVADMVGASANTRVLDACAAPGGKAMRMLANGAEVIACDRDMDRLEKLEESLERTGLQADRRLVDWETEPWLPAERFDAVLVDAPCTALGTTRRHPELRWSRRPSDPAAMSIRQLRVVEGALPAVKPGGVLVYSVCSPEPEEGRVVVKRLLERHPGLVVETELLTAPPLDEEDAHYAARIRTPEET